MPVTPTVLREYDRSQPGTDSTETATFGLGCFWGPDATFGALDGVVRTRVGYAGGAKSDPSYHSLGDHSEVVQIDYDPDRIEYREILDVAFRSHDPRTQPRKQQYQNVILTHDERQHELVESYLGDSVFDRETIQTRIEGLSQFHPAETYHQKYNLRGKRWLTDEFEEAGYDETDIRDSPAAAKLNAHVGGKDVSVPFLDARSR